MQRLGLPRTDIEVHIERTRAVNDATARDPAIEANCVLALEIVIGEAGDLSLSWDNVEMAVIYVPRVVAEAAVRANLGAALEASDMLPPRPGTVAFGRTLEEAPARLIEHLRSSDWRPLRVDEFRVPKGPFTTRPASLLALADRLVYEVLASLVETSLDIALPDAVIWPRRRDQRADSNAFRVTPTTWTAPYIVKADIAGFYESVDHSLLAMILAGALDARSDEVQAIEHFLGAVMNRPVGLPQGPLASDIFASAYLALIDQRLVRNGWTYARFADDYFITAESMADGRNKIETLERYLGNHHLRLNDPKTTIMRHETYIAGLDRPPPALAALRSELRQHSEDAIKASQDSDEAADVLTEHGADEQLLFDVLYHATMTVEEAIKELGDRLDPDAASLHLAYLTRLDSQLSGGEPPEDMSSVFVLVRDCIAYMAAAREPKALHPTERLLSWFPGLGPVVSIYYEFIAELSPEGVDAALVRLLRPDELPDWTSAWLCSSVQRRSGAASSTLLDQLRMIVANSSYGPLTRMCSTWALASQHALVPGLWTAILADASDALRAELLLAQQRDPDLYPWSGITALPSPPTVVDGL